MNKATRIGLGLILVVLLPAEAFGYLFFCDFNDGTTGGLSHYELFPPVDYTDSYPQRSPGDLFLRRHCQTNSGYSEDDSLIFEYVESGDFQRTSFYMFADFRLNEFTSNEARFGLFTLFDFDTPSPGWGAGLYYDGTNTQFDLNFDNAGDLTGTAFDIFEWFNLRFDITYTGSGTAELLATLWQPATGYYREFSTTSSVLSGTTAGLYTIVDNTPYPPGSEFTFDVDNFGINPEPATILLMLISCASCFFTARGLRKDGR